MVAGEPLFEEWRSIENMYVYVCVCVCVCAPNSAENSEIVGENPGPPSTDSGVQVAILKVPTTYPTGGGGHHFFLF